MNVMSRTVSESPDDVEISIDHATFVWDGASWYEKRTFLAPPLEKVHQLNRQLEERLAATDSRLANPFALVREATRAENAEQHQRAVRLARRALCFSPNNEAAATVLSSALRATGRADEALAATDAFPRSDSAPLLTTRAAALCDLGRWPEALRTVRRALAASSGRGDAPFAVLNRIRTAAPDLF
jgi:tetratricopeptide (TPR) repeat protein